MTNSPQVAISYSWSSSEHVQWVIDLASQLREYGVDVKLDKWDLKEGNDAIKFMEQMVSDPNIKKVIMVLVVNTRKKPIAAKAELVQRRKSSRLISIKKLTRTSFWV